MKPQPEVPGRREHFAFSPLASGRGSCAIEHPRSIGLVGTGGSSLYDRWWADARWAEARCAPRNRLLQLFPLSPALLLVGYITRANICASLRYSWPCHPSATLRPAREETYRLHPHASSRYTFPLFLFSYLWGRRHQGHTGSREIYSLVQPATLALGWLRYTLVAWWYPASREPHDGQIYDIPREVVLHLSNARPSTTYISHHCPSSNPLPFACLRHRTLLPILSAAKTATLLRLRSSLEFIPAANRGRKAAPYPRRLYVRRFQQYCCILRRHLH